MLLERVAFLCSALLSELNSEWEKEKKDKKNFGFDDNEKHMCLRLALAHLKCIQCV